MPEKRSRVRAHFVVGGIALLLALAVAKPVYLEIVARNAPAAAGLRGKDVRGVVPFGYYVLLMALTGTTVCAVVMFLRSRSKVPEDRLLETGFVSWFAVWAFLPFALLSDVAFNSPWWPVIGWGGSVALLLAIFMRGYVRLHWIRRTELAGVRGVRPQD